jgi:hypothetical protein
MTGTQQAGNAQAQRAKAAMQLTVGKLQALASAYDTPIPGKPGRMRVSNPENARALATAAGNALTVAATETETLIRTYPEHPAIGPLQDAIDAAIETYSEMIGIKQDDPAISGAVQAMRGAVGERHSRTISQDVKIQVAHRDGGRCVQCGSDKHLHYDHKIPWSRGGTNSVNNIQLLCGDCNRRKGATDSEAV